MFIDDVIVIHGSSVYNNNTGYVFTGSGGSGKTAISTSLISEKNYKFIADDITFLSKDGRLYGNFEFPKIYHYNVKKIPISKKS
jgi:serine kinase of HPr protein (carbohydrate metabolism regulator)